jgi:hypothetical protein
MTMIAAWENRASAGSSVPSTLPGLMLDAFLTHPGSSAALSRRRTWVVPTEEALQLRRAASSLSD